MFLRENFVFSLINFVQGKTGKTLPSSFTMSILTLEAKLERLDPNTPWGFRMQGGKDFHSALMIQKVSKKNNEKKKERKTKAAFKAIKY